MTADTMVGAPPRGGQRLRLLLHSRTGMLGLVLVGFLLVLAIAQAFGLVGTDPLKQAASIRLQGPSAAPPRNQEVLRKMPPNRNSQKPRALMRGNATSRAPICRGMR